MESQRSLQLKIFSEDLGFESNFNFLLNLEKILLNHLLNSYVSFLVFGQEIFVEFVWRIYLLFYGRIRIGFVCIGDYDKKFLRIYLDAIVYF